MGGLLDKPDIPRPSLPPTPSKEITDEAMAARREMEMRMRRTEMSRQKSQLTPPALAETVKKGGPQLMERLG